MKKLFTLFAAAMMLFGVQNANAFTLTCLSGSDFGGNEGCQKLFDGTQGTKWGTWDGWYGNTVHAIFKTALPIAATSYELVIANDTPGSPGRNWKKWSLYAANFASDADATKDATGWVMIDQKDEDLVTGTTNNSYVVNTLTISDPQTTAYSYYKIVVEELVGGWGEYCQMDEFRFKDFTIDVSGAQQYVDFDYETGTDADLKAAYAEKLANLNAGISANDPDLIVPAVDAIMPVYTKINTLRNGGYVALQWTSSWGDGPGSNLVDKNDDSKWGGNFPDEGEHVQYVVFRTQAQQPFFYKLVTGGDTEKFNTRNWKTWKVFGGNFASEADAARSAEGWVLLDQRADITEEYLPNKNNYPATFDFSEGVNTAYSYYKVEVTASGGGQQQMSEMYLCSQEEFEAIRQPLVEALQDFAAGLDALVVEADREADKATFAEKYEILKTTADAVALTKVYNELVALKEALEYSASFVAGGFRCLSGNTAWGDNENWMKLVDGDTKTKWGGGMPDGGSYVIFKTYAKNAFNQYMLVTGNDTKNNPGRNWKTWKIYGANVKGDMDELAVRNLEGWTLIDEKTSIGQDRLPADNFAPAYFNFTNPAGYKYFKIEVEEAYSGSSIQMSEFKMLSDDEYAAIRQEYVDELTDMVLPLAEQLASLDISDEVKNQIMEDAQAKRTAVATATADNLLLAYNAALNYINVEAPAIVAQAQLPELVDGVYQLSTATHMASFAALVNSGTNDANAVLMNNIDLSKVITDNAWTSIGTNDIPFKGSFDGQGYTISGITYTATGQYNGLFGKLSTGAVVKNFTAEGTMTVSTGVTGRAVALIAVAGDGGVLIQNINSKMNYNNKLAGAQVGGVLGGALNGNQTVVDRCTYSGILDGNDAGGSGNYGGLVGYANNNSACYLTISNCLFDGQLKNTAATPGNCTFGGVIGYSNGANVAIKNCLVIGTMQSAIVAPFFGAVKSTRSSIANSFYKGDYASVNGSPSTVTLNPQEATQVTDEQLASEEVVLKLGIAFRQDLGTDAYPAPDPTKPAVVKITDAGYATLFVDNADLTVPAGVKAYTAEFESTWLKLNEVGGAFAAGEPVILKGAAGVYSFAPTTGATKDEGNVLKGAADDIAANGLYILAQPQDEPVGFYKSTTGTIKAGKAYLASSNDVKAFLFSGDDATGISNLNANLNANGAIFNLAGQRMSKMQKGINIVAGKKVLK